MQSLKHVVKNQFLATLPKDVQERLLRQVRSVRLDAKITRSKPGKDAEEIYFPQNCLISLFRRMPDNTLFEVATVGREGISSPVFLQPTNISLTSICLIAGSAFKIKATVLLNEVKKNRILARQVFRSSIGLISQSIVRTSCNQRHSVEERSAALLLRISDQINTKRFPLTHQKISLMLNVGRPRVTAALGLLQDLKLIDLRRGAISILDRQRLIEVSCFCYNILKTEDDNLYQTLLD